jgi:hypothetical protein
MAAEFNYQTHRLRRTRRSDVTPIPMSPPMTEFHAASIKA